MQKYLKTENLLIFLLFFKKTKIGKKKIYFEKDCHCWRNLRQLWKRTYEVFQRRALLYRATGELHAKKPECW